MADIGEIGVDFDDIGHRAAAGLDLGLERLQSRSRLRLEVAGVGDIPIVVIGHLARDEEGGLGAARFDRLRIGRRIPHPARGILLDLSHGSTSCERNGSRLKADGRERQLALS